MSFKKVTHVIFDFDGLIIESESIYKRVIAEMAAEFGKEYTKEMQIKIMGTPEPITAKIAIEELQLPYTVDQFLDIYLNRAKELLHHPKLMPGAEELVYHLHKHKIPIAVATSAAKEMMEVKIQDYKELVSLFHHVVCGSTDPEVKNGKPAPDIFLVCASRFPDKPQPDQCLVLEDAPNGAKGAVTAGMQVVLVPDPIVPEEKRQPATLVLNSLTEFKPELFGLPPFGRMSFKKVSHVIFDLDGLILESESIYDQVISDIAAPFGKEYTNDIRLKIMGTPDIVTAEIAIKEMDLPYTVQEFLDIYHPKSREYLKHPKLMPGAEKLIRHLHKHKISIAVATSSPQDLFDIKTQDHKELVSLFSHVVCGSSDPEVKNGKPAPDIFLVCASRFLDKPKPRECLVFEDAPNGVQGAAAAGMQVVMVPDPLTPQELRNAATLVLSTLEEFKPEAFGLPAFL